MRVALDYNDNRVCISDTKSNQEYYCPFCGETLITRRGEIRQHHFAHKPSHPCSDSWERTGAYDLSDWHNDWQRMFPVENQEVKVELGEISHRADVMVGRTVVEFQHSVIHTKSFHDRNEFYFNRGYKVVWLFDLRETYKSGQLSFRKQEDGLTFRWNAPKRVFSDFDIACGCVDLFFQISDEEDSIVRVRKESERGFAEFETSAIFSKQQFLEYFGYCNGACPLPELDDIATNESYQNFKEKYNIQLNLQQERALQAVEGHNLLLAVPGSGKTTVLVARLGYMILERGIAPESILALAFNKKAVDEMKTRFHQKFGDSVGTGIRFQTLNSLAVSIYKQYCNKTGHPVRKHISDQDIRLLLKKIYKEMHPDDYADESTVLDLRSTIAYIKNSMLSAQEISKLENSVGAVYNSYQAELKRRMVMDFDDQMVFAEWILSHDETTLKEMQTRFRYICVDEAQDTSKIQHAIIAHISAQNHLFMVGDEDQSIYGFRSAYPKALLNFRYDYTNPYILRMERNYRSTPQIVQKAKLFISKNSGRYEKEMTAERENGSPVNKIDVPSRGAQFDALLDIAKGRSTETAFLYRDNESSVVLIDLFLRNEIPFVLKKPDMNFFGNRIIKDIISYLRLSLDAFDTEAFECICNKGILFIKEKQRKYTIENCKRHHISVFESLRAQMKYVSTQYKDRADDFESVMKKVADLPSGEALDYIARSGYKKYLTDNHLDLGKFEIMRKLAEQEPDKKAFLLRLKTLNTAFQTEHKSSGENPIMLSTIHSSKGLEYDTVYMVDVYDGRFPSSHPGGPFHSKDDADAEQEERRLFYVGITRAKNRLFLMNIQDKSSQYISELFPTKRDNSLMIQVRDFLSTSGLRGFFHQDVQISYDQFTQTIPQESSRPICEQRRDPAKELEVHRQEVEGKFTQQTKRVFDSTGQRWVRCEQCGKIKPDTEFAFYGGVDHVNLGTCSECARKL